MAFIKATKRHHRKSTRSDSCVAVIAMLLFQGYFIVKSLKKSSSCPNNNRGVTFQTDRKDLAEVMEHLYRGAKLVS